MIVVDKKLIRVLPEDIKDGHFDVPAGVTRIGESAFEYCPSLKEVIIPDSVTRIGEFAFGCSHLTNITVDKNNKYYSSEDGVLFNKDKTKLIKCPAGKCGNYTTPDSVTSIGDGAFFCCGLESINIPNSVTEIGNWAFSNCENLESIIIPDSVTKIGKYAFVYCYHLTDVSISDGITKVGDYAFLSCDAYIHWRKTDKQLETKPQTKKNKEEPKKITRV